MFDDKGLLVFFLQTATSYYHREEEIQRSLVVVEPLLRKHLRKRTPTSNAALHLSSPVLEPDSQLVLSKTQLGSQSLSPGLREVLVRLELVSQTVQLLAGKGGPGFLVVAVRLLRALVASSARGRPV